MAFETWLVSSRAPIRRERVAPLDAFARWEEHRNRFGETGLWPMIFLAERMDLIESNFRDQGAGVEDHIAMGLNLDIQDFFSGILGDYAEDEEFEMDLDFDPSGLVPDGIDNDLEAIVQSGEDHWIALLPCHEPWEALAVLGYGGWNGCPMPAVHVAVLREWHSRHEAVPLMLGGDTLQLIVRPIEDPEEAKRVAIEQYAYCSDIVDQGVGSVEDLAASLLGSSVWFFWWD